MEQQLLTIGQIADVLEEPPARVAYVISKYRLKPVQRVGIIRLFDEGTMVPLQQHDFLLSEYRTVELVDESIGEIYINIVELGSEEISSLGAGETSTILLTVQLQQEFYSLSVFADSARVIDESNERNNWDFIRLS